MFRIGGQFNLGEKNMCRCLVSITDVCFTCDKCSRCCKEDGCRSKKKEDLASPD